MEDGHSDPRENRFNPVRSNRDSGKGREDGGPSNAV